MPDADSAKPLAIFVHGTFCTKWPEGSAVKDHVEETASHDIEEFRWSGENTHSARRDAGADLAQFIRKLPDRRSVLVCHSHGGNVAGYALRHLAADSPEKSRVDRVICLATPHVMARARDFSAAAVFLGWGIGLLVTLVLLMIMLVGVAVVERELSRWLTFTALAIAFVAGIAIGAKVHSKVSSYAPGSEHSEFTLQPDFRSVEVVSAIVGRDEVRIGVGGFSQIVGIPFAIWYWARQLAFDGIEAAKAALIYSMVPGAALLLVFGLPSDTIVQLFVTGLTYFFYLVLLLLPFYVAAMGLLLLRALAYSHHSAMDEALEHLSVNLSMNPYRPLLADDTRCYFKQFRSQYPWWSMKQRHSEVYKSEEIASDVTRWLTGPLMIDQAPMPVDRRRAYRSMKDRSQQWFEFLWKQDDKVTRPVSTTTGQMMLAGICVLVGLASAFVTFHWVGNEILVDSADTFAGKLGLIGFFTLFVVLASAMFLRTSIVASPEHQASSTLLIVYCMNLSLLASSTTTFLFFQGAPRLYFLVGAPFTVGALEFGTLGLLTGLLTFFVTRVYLQRSAKE